MISKQTPFKLLIQTNSPGELSSWVKPITETFSKKNSSCEILVFLTPCQYASGQEVAIAKTLPNVVAVYSPKDTLKHLYSLPFRYQQKKGAVLFLGGDPTYSKILGFKHKLPVFGYAHFNQGLGPGITRITNDEVGDLMADSVHPERYNREEILRKNHLPEDDYTVFFCGSRPQHFKAFLPLICETIQYIKGEKAGFKAIINISPFITDTDVHDASKDINTTGIIFLRSPSHEIMSIAKLLVTLPGTNTAEAMYMNLPMLVVAPLNKPELIILDGLAGLIEKLPVVGPLIKQAVIAATRKKMTFVALPNRIANKEIVPEYVGIVEEKELAQKIIFLLNTTSEYEKIKKKLTDMKKDRDVAAKIYERITHP